MQISLDYVKLSEVIWIMTRLFKLGYPLGAGEEGLKSRFDCVFDAKERTTLNYEYCMLHQILLF